MQNKILGVIGGLGPMATAHFMALVTEMTDARTDQDHLEMIIHSDPSIPDRTQHILDSTKPTPLPRMLAIGQQLAGQGAGIIAVPCVTAHYFWDILDAGICVPVINGVRETVAALKAQKLSRIGIMATDGTVRSGIFSKELTSQGLIPIIPSPDCQRKVMGLIFDNIKAGIPAQMENFHAVRRELQRSGAQAIILGCTELSLIKRDYPIGPGFIDAMEVLAQQSVLRCGKALKPEYTNLIT